MNLNTKRLTEQSHSLESFLIIRSTSSNEDSDLVLLKLMLVFLERSDDSLEGRSDVGEVGNSSTDDEDLSFFVGRSTSHQIDCATTLISVNHGIMRKGTYEWSWRTRTSDSELALRNIHRN